MVLLIKLGLMQLFLVKYLPDLKRSCCTAPLHGSTCIFWCQLSRILGQLCDNRSFCPLNRQVIFTNFYIGDVCKSDSAGADPGLVVGGGTNPLDGSADPIFFIHFLKNPMNFLKNSSVGGGGGRVLGAPLPLDQPL